jgi:hypothetical protein
MSVVARSLSADPEVRELDLRGLGEKDIRPLDVSVHLLHGVQVGQTLHTQHFSRVNYLGAAWLAVRQARVRISARQPMEVPLTKPAAVKT